MAPPPNIDHDVLTELLELAVHDTYFIFNSTIYQQIGGVAMGSPLGPTFANAFMSHMESKYLTPSLPSTPRFYCRYVDDSFCLFDDSVEASHFLQRINNLRFLYTEKTLLPL